MSGHTPRTADIAGKPSSWMAAGGILTVMLFPFALPCILLLVASAIPLALVAVAGAAVAAPVVLAVALGRRVINALRPRAGSSSEFRFLHRSEARQPSAR